ncbi:MAG: deoxyribodipyrimidine photo-lyase [Glaciecola sp.]|jgi:deoxyribodipyrimidine photo-lyase
MSRKIGLHWFRKDLRIQDNLSLARMASQVDELVCIYIYHDEHNQHNINTLHKSEAIGKHRLNFLHQTLQDLDRSLGNLNHRLVVLSANSLEPIDVITETVKALNVTHLGAEWHCGFNERSDWQHCKDAVSELNPDIEFIQENSSTLFNASQFPFSIENMPATFSPFRKKIEKYCEVEQVNEPVVALPPMSDILAIENRVDVANLFVRPNYYENLSGGPGLAQQQLTHYLWSTDHIASYKETRNGLDGWDFSSKFSAWLALGCIGPRQIYAELCRYESERTKNDSTYWLFFELLWREFFHWHHFVHGKRLFAASGVQQIARSTNFEHDTFLKWQQGQTGYPIVDACMRQLLETGYMSNRGRQLVASCFVHELGQDWRYGAKYFEYQLIDFDVASNWGNWQYLGGVGADPRGHRQFNLQKQTETYDPNNEFINQWLS